MASDDDVAYHKSVRNMSLVLAAIVITIFAAIFVPPYLSPQHDVFQTSTTLDSPFGFTMHLEESSTSLSSNGTLLISGWLNSTSANIENVTASDSWGLNQDLLSKVMQGHYTNDNYTLGTLLNITSDSGPSACPTIGSPTYFLFESHSSKALVNLNAGPTVWVMQTSFSLGGSATGTPLKPGVYTSVLADEWGDVLTTNFLVS
jgi:hypothetical protein